MSNRFFDAIKAFFARKEAKQVGLVVADGLVEAIGAYARSTREIYDDLLYSALRAKVDEFKAAGNNPEKLAHLAASLPVDHQERLAAAVGDNKGEAVA